MAHLRLHDHAIVYGAPVQDGTGGYLKYTNGLNEQYTSTTSSGEDFDVSDGRVGCPFLSPLPVEAYPLDPEADAELDKQWKSHLRDAIKDDLRERNFFFHNVGIEKHAPKFKSQDKKITSVVITAFRNGGQEGFGNQVWLAICRDLYAKFIRDKIPNLHIEIRDLFCPLYIETKPLLPDDKIIPIWPAVRGACLRRLKCRPQWLAIGVYRRKRALEHEWVTIVISVQHNGTVTPWRDVRDKLLEDLEALGLPEVAVEFIAEDGPSDEFIWHPDCVNENDLGEPARMGRSLGVRHNHDLPFLTGTLGGFVTLKFPDKHAAGVKKQTFGMTCFHCVEDHRRSAAERREWAMTGILPRAAGLTIEVLQPAYADVQRWLEHLSKEIDKAKARKESNSKFTEIIKGTITPRPLADLEKEYASIQAFCKPRPDINDDGLRLGYLFAASGQRLTPTNRLLDWALIEIDPERMPQPPTTYPKDIISQTSPPSLTPPPQLTGYRDPIPGETVILLGRTSGLTHGVINLIPDTIHQMNNHRIHHDLSDDSWAEEYVVVGTDLDGAAFSRRGDSGAWVVSSDTGKYLGHIWSGKRKICVSMITLATDTMEDILWVTGADGVEVGIDAV
ncbi:hypothetical protein AAP_00510 [Ascosphaera apis ARSEF 7405]|uniref:Uncharacterized protein n=1 Tax=Ascosphaera apis ARSEF 7405 TaxID=392613 RepID=A0A168DYL7_9EURO|nr:hypothetical protein AAP_00510 [Ascosphaera apis ARSEF 7405]